jgi:hypothetical protein
MNRDITVLAALGTLIAWSVLLLIVSIMTLRQYDRRRRRRTEMAELQMLWETVGALDAEYVRLAKEKGIEIVQSPMRRTYREWWERSKALNPNAAARE